jgi:hypothetical protein
VLCKILSKTFLILKIQRVVIINVRRSSGPYVFMYSTCYYCQILMILNFLDNPQIQNSTKVRPVGAELFHEDGQT